MIKILTKILDWLFPRRCYVCKKTSNSAILCQSCFEQINILPPYPIKKFNSVKIFAASEYSGILKKIIRALKYHNKKELSKESALIMHNFWKKVSDKKDFYEIIPTPTFVSRLKERKYDHIKLLCNDFAAISGYRVNDKVLSRVKNTKPQYKLTRKEREENLKDAFEAIQVVNVPVLLVDDICTSGATIFEMVRTIQKVGIEDITVLCLSCNESYVNDFQVF